MNLRDHRRKVLRKIGFKPDKGKKHEKWVLKDSRTGRLYLKTVVSRNNRDIGDNLLKAICGQLHITKRQYNEIASCSMSKQQYYDHLREAEIIT